MICFAKSLPVFAERQCVKFVAITLAAAIVECETIVLLHVVPKLLHVAVARPNDLSKQL